MDMFAHLWHISQLPASTSPSYPVAVRCRHALEMVIPHNPRVFLFYFVLPPIAYRPNYALRTMFETHETNQQTNTKNAAHATLQYVITASSHRTTSHRAINTNKLQLFDSLARRFVRVCVRVFCCAAPAPKLRACVPAERCCVYVRRLCL